MTAELASNSSRFRSGQSALVLTVAVLSCCVGYFIPSSGLLRPMMAAIAAFLLVIAGLKAPRLLLVALVVWLAILGLIRRLLSGLSPALPQGDPLLLVAALAWVVLALMAFRRGAFAGRTPLGGSVLALTLLLAASAVNPLQGGLAIGLGGLLLVVVPMLAFWVGRRLTNDSGVEIIFVAVAILACGAATYGLAQTFRGLPSWDNRWVVQSGYAALNVNGRIRAFGTFSSSAEYASFLSLAIVACLAWIVTRRLMLLVLFVPISLLAVAVWFESARGTIVLLVAAVCLMFGAAKGLTLRRGLIAGVVVLGILPSLIGRLAPSQFGTGTGSQLAAHQVAGLSDPLGKGSTLPGHFKLTIDGMRLALQNPVGRGVGVITIAANKFGGANGGTEADPGNAGIAGGLAGLVVYGFVFVLGFRRTYDIAVDRRDSISLIALGALVVTFFQWLNGAQYAVAFVPWLVLGWADSGRARTVPRAGCDSP